MVLRWNPSTIGQAWPVLADYYTAFSTLNVDAILPYFHDPALLIGRQGVVAVPTSAALAGFFTPVMEDLRSRGWPERV
jgi:hypothetical protein